MKFKTVLEGQEAVILNYLGEGRLVKGPQRVCITCPKISFMIKGFLSLFQFLKFFTHMSVICYMLKINPDELLLKFCQGMPSILSSTLTLGQSGLKLVELSFGNILITKN